MASPKEVKTVIKIAPTTSDHVIQRLRVILETLELMERDERSAALTYLKSRYRTDWQSIHTAPKDRFIFLYCPEDRSRWLAKWQGHGWVGVDADHGLTREGYSFGDPNVVTGWGVTQWHDTPPAPSL